MVATGAMLVCWMLWKERNSRIFDHKDCATAQVYRSIRDEMLIWREAGVFKHREYHVGVSPGSCFSGFSFFLSFFATGVGWGGGD